MSLSIAPDICWAWELPGTPEACTAVSVGSTRQEEGLFSRLELSLASRAALLPSVSGPVLPYLLAKVPSRCEMGTE